MNGSAKLDDITLWNAFRQGDETAFAALYRQFAPVLYSYGYHLCRNRDLTEDCIQDLFVHLHQHRAGLGATDSIKYYLYRSLRRRIAEKAQANSRWTYEEDLHAPPEFELELAIDSQLIDEQTARDQQAKLHHLLNRLPKRQREALFLLYFEEMSYPDIAQTMGLEVKSVYNLIYNSLVTLRGYIAKTDLQFFGLLGWWLLG